LELHDRFTEIKHNRARKVQLASHTLYRFWSGSSRRCPHGRLVVYSRMFSYGKKCQSYHSRPRLL